MPITLTEKAASHVQAFLSKRGKGVGLRLGVKTTGCSGLAYKLEFADDVLPEDRERAVEAGMDDFLTKPLIPVDLGRCVRRWAA